MKRIFSALFAALTFLTASSSANCTDEQFPKGWLLWHSYSDYSAMDSRLFLRHPDGNVTEITGDFVHPMNGSFGTSPCDIVFMAIDRAADEWDIYRYNSITGNITNLTEKSGFRNEDPKFSADGMTVVFKRGHWDNSVNDFKYDLAELDLHSGEVKYLTDDTAEEAMPCYSGDGKYIYFARYESGISSICRLNRADGTVEPIYAESGVTAYYPVTLGDAVYFTKWHSAENRNDMIMKYENGISAPMPFNSAGTNCSDACPVDGNAMIYSCTAESGYDLYLFDGENSMPLSELNTEKNELGASFYTADKFGEYLRYMEAFLMGAECPEGDYDLDGSGKVDVFDLVHARMPS